MEGQYAMALRSMKYLSNLCYIQFLFMINVHNIFLPSSSSLVSLIHFGLHSLCCFRYFNEDSRFFLSLLPFAYIPFSGNNNSNEEEEKKAHNIKISCEDIEAKKMVTRIYGHLIFIYLYTHRISYILLTLHKEENSSDMTKSTNSIEWDYVYVCCEMINYFRFFFCYTSPLSSFQ